jgi:hypothetical protein
MLTGASGSIAAGRSGAVAPGAMRLSPRGSSLGLEKGILRELLKGTRKIAVGCHFDVGGVSAGIGRRLKLALPQPLDQERLQGGTIEAPVEPAVRQIPRMLSCTASGTQLNTPWQIDVVEAVRGKLGLGHRRCTMWRRAAGSLLRSRVANGCWSAATR